MATPPKKKPAQSWNTMSTTPKKVVRNPRAQTTPAKKPASKTPMYDSVVREKGFDPLGPKKKK